MRQRPLTVIAAMTAITIASPVVAQAQDLSSLLSSSGSSGSSNKNDEVDPGFSMSGPCGGTSPVDPGFSVAAPGGGPLVDPGFSVAKPTGDEIGTPPFDTFEHAEEFLTFMVQIPPSALESDEELWDYLEQFIQVQKENRAAGLEYIIGVATDALNACVSAEYMSRLQDGINNNGGPVVLAEVLAANRFDLSVLADPQLAQDLADFPRS